MPRIYCHKDSAETVSEKFRDKSEIAFFEFFSFMLYVTFWTVNFYGCFVLFTKITVTGRYSD